MFSYKISYTKEATIPCSLTQTLTDLSAGQIWSGWRKNIHWSLLLN